jgi:hypothetical protein
VRNLTVVTTYLYLWYRPWQKHSKRLFIIN